MGDQARRTIYIHCWQPILTGLKKSSSTVLLIRWFTACIKCGFRPIGSCDARVHIKKKHTKIMHFDSLACIIGHLIKSANFYRFGFMIFVNYIVIQCTSITPGTYFEKELSLFLH